MSHEHVYVDAILSEARRHGEVEGITVVVGLLAPILAEDLERALSFTGWTIRIIENPGLIQCPCGYRGPPAITEKGHEYTIYHCPKCARDLPPILDGKEVVLQDVTVKE